jgi:hypothetical protein
MHEPLQLQVPVCAAPGEIVRVRQRNPDVAAPVVNE